MATNEAHFFKWSQSYGQSTAKPLASNQSLSCCRMRGSVSSLFGLASKWTQYFFSLDSDIIVQRKQEIMTTHDHVLKNQTLATIIPSISILSLSFLFSSNVHSLTSLSSFLLYVRLIYIFIVFSHSSYFSSSL